MGGKLDVKQGTLALMILRTLEVLGPLHGYGIARRIEETSKNRSRSTTARSTPPCSSSSRRASSKPSGGIREQPAREVLYAHGRRQEAARARST